MQLTPHPIINSNILNNCVCVCVCMYLRLDHYNVLHGMVVPVLFPQTGHTLCTTCDVRTLNPSLTNSTLSYNLLSNTFHNFQLGYLQLTTKQSATHARIIFVQQPL